MSSEPARKTTTVAKAARILGIGQTRAYTLAKEGKLPGCIEVGGRYLVSIKRLEEFIDGQTKREETAA